MRHCTNAISLTLLLSTLLSFWLYIPFRQLCSSSDRHTLRIPFMKTKSFGQRSFSFTGPTQWNSLPYEVHHSVSVPALKTAFKTLQVHIFCIPPLLVAQWKAICGHRSCSYVQGQTRGGGGGLWGPKPPPPLAPPPKKGGEEKKRDRERREGKRE